MTEAIKFNPLLSVPGYWDTLQSHINEWARKTNACSFWSELSAQAPAWNVEYKKKYGCDLFANKFPPEFISKDLTRIKEKLFELDPDKWFTSGIPQLKDMVRTRIDCSFIDGVSYLSEKLIALAENQKVFMECKKKGEMSGYFAHHIYFHEDVVFNFAGVKQAVVLTCEIQIATSLATKIWESNHHIYEKFRNLKEEPEDWQWNPRDPRFLARQMAQMMHLADGLLVQIRDLEQGGKS